MTRSAPVCAVGGRTVSTLEIIGLVVVVLAVGGLALFAYLRGRREWKKYRE